MTPYQLWGNKIMKNKFYAKNTNTAGFNQCQNTPKINKVPSTFKINIDKTPSAFKTHPI